jgi:hypothetical protein
MKRYSFALAANQALDVQIGGEYFLLDSTPFGVAVEFYGANGLSRNVRLDDGLSGDWAKPEGGFASIKLINGALAQAVVFYVARGEVGRFRIFGEVSVIDGGRSRTLANAAFSSAAGVSAAAGQFACAQLLNPAASGRRLILTQLILGIAGAASNIQVGQHDAALATLVGAPLSKNLGGAVSVAQLRVESAVALPLVAPFLSDQYAQQATTAPPIVFREPIVLAEGVGILVQSNLAANAVIATFEFTEEDVT